MYHIIFDMDGVLSDSWDNVIDVIIPTGLQGNTREEVLHNHMRYCTQRPDHSRGQNFTDDKYSERLRRVADLGRLLLQNPPPLFNSFISELTLIRDGKFAITSSNAKAYVDHQAKRIPISFTHVLSFEDSPSKEEKIERICKDWGIDVSDNIYITDTLADVYELETLLPKDHIIGCAWGYNGYVILREELSKEQILREPKDIHGALSRIPFD